MISNETKLKFVELRANNISLSSIAKQLHISRATCSKLGRELESDITVKHAERKEEINDLYTMDRQHRISRLQTVLKRLDEAINNTDFSQMTPEALLKMKLRYESELSKEYPIMSSKELSDFSYESALSKINELIQKYERGELSPNQFKSGLDAVNTLIKTISKKGEIWHSI